MIFNKIELHNFRQFYGTQEIIFSIKDGKHVTVIHGENGSGKTALLNAFNWCLYGKTDLPKPNDLINEFAYSEMDKLGKVEMYIELEFKSRQTEYLLRRTLKFEEKDKWTFAKDTTGEVTLKYYSDDRYKEIGNPSIELNQILPENMRNYFFFDGERIDNLSKQEDSLEIKEAIKTIMDLEVLERSIEHTKSVKKQFMDEFKENTNDSTKLVVNQLENATSKLDNMKVELDQVKNNISIRKSQKQDIEIKLSKIDSIAVIQQERMELEKEKGKSEMELRDVSKKITQKISKEGYLAITRSLVHRVSERLEETNNTRSSRVEVPIRVLKTIIENDKCICGTSLSDGQDALAEIKHLLDHSSPDNEATSYAYLSGDNKLVDSYRNRFFEDLTDLRKREANLIEHIDDTMNRIEEKSAEISKRDFEDLNGLEKKRKTFELEIESYQKDLGLLENSIENYEREIKDLEKQLAEQKEIESKAVISKKRYETSAKILDVMEQIHIIKENEVKVELKERLKKVYSYFLRKEYSIDLSSDFTLIVKNKSQKKVAMSQGERQITSLSFIGAIVEMAREKYNKRSGNGIGEGGIYPLVMDSPFGALDSDHRKRVAQGVHKLSDQIIVILSTSQWKGQVEESLSNYVGSSYTLDYQAPMVSGDPSFEFTKIEVSSK
ncbi:AAA family ATPase [Jeotgalibacillus marinus]|uniref:Nuclease SbcCD subunit C n=1 Tax=Jeotgalibacillus marinus TaxID=86667 RepID=A0ABV3Q6R6_9BACL